MVGGGMVEKGLQGLRQDSAQRDLSPAIPHADVCAKLGNVTAEYFVYMF